MSQEPFVHPLDQEDRYDGNDSSHRNSRRRTSGLSILAVLGAIFLLVTIGATGLINASDNASSDQLGVRIWTLGAIGMLICCLLTLGITRRKQWMGLVQKFPGRSEVLKSSLARFLLWSLGGFFVLSLTLSMVHLTIGSLKAFYLISVISPFAIAVVLALIGTTQRQTRAFWIGFATSMVLGIYGYDINQYRWNRIVVNSAKAPASVIYGNPQNFPPGSAIDPRFGTGRGLGINVPPASSSGALGYRFEYRMLLAQVSTFAWALLTGLICAGVVVLLVPEKV